MANAKNKFPVLHVDARTAFAVIAIVAVVSAMGLVVFFGGTKPASDLPEEEQILKLLGDELNKINDLNTTEMENLLEAMVGG